MSVEEQIRANARSFVEKAGPGSGLENFGYNAESVKWVEGFIERQRVRRAEFDNIEGLISVVSCFVGECVIACFGGEWQMSDGMWCVAFDSGGVDKSHSPPPATSGSGDSLPESPTNLDRIVGGAVYPFNKVRKQFDNGVEESVYSWFQTIPELFAKCVKPNAPPVSKRWWKWQPTSPRGDK